MTEQAEDTYHPAPSTLREQDDISSSTSERTSSVPSLRHLYHSFLLTSPLLRLYNLLLSPPLLESLLFLVPLLVSPSCHSSLFGKSALVSSSSLFRLRHSLHLLLCIPHFYLIFFFLKTGLDSCFTVTPWPHLPLKPRLGRREKKIRKRYIEQQIRKVSIDPWKNRINLAPTIKETWTNGTVQVLSCSWDCVLLKDSLPLLCISNSM